MQAHLHRLLKRQLKRYLSDKKLTEDEDFNKFIEAVNDAYRSFESDLEHSESILEQSHRELFQANEILQKRAEQSESEALQAQTELESVLDNINEVIFHTDINGNWTYLNKAWTKLTGFSIEEALGNSLVKLFTEEDRKQFMLEFKELISGRLTEYEETYSYRNVENYKKWIRIRCEPIFNNVNKITGAVGTLRDVTDQYLAEQEIQRLSLVARKTANMVVITDAEERITWVNHAFEKVSGFQIDEVKGKIPGHFLQGPRTNQQTRNEIRKAIDSQQSFKGTILNYSKTGVPYWVRLVIDPIFSDFGEYQGSIVIESDVTKEVDAQGEVEKSKTYLETLLNNIPDAICALDKNLTLIMSNDVFKKLFKVFYDVDVLEGSDLKNGLGNDLNFWEDFIGGAFIESSRRVHPFTTPEGEEHLYDLQALPITLKSKSVGVLLLGRDITLENKQKIALEESKEQLEKAQEIAKLGSFRINRNGQVEVSAQLQSMLKLKKDFLRIEAFAKRLFPETPNLLTKIAAKVQGKGGMRTIEHTAKLPKGEEIDLNTVIMDVEGDEFRKHYAWGICLDITLHKNNQRTLKTTNEKLENINRELDRFAYIISHDLKTPLRAIYNLSFFIQEDIQNTNLEDAESKLKMLIDRTEFMEKLIEGVLDYSRAGKLNSSPKMVNTEQLINELIISIKAQRSVAVSLEGEWPSVVTDEIPFVQVLSNLLSNSSKYNDKDQLELVIRSKFNKKEDQLSISVKDNGPGIPLDQQEKVFELFKTLAGTKGQKLGTGIGLAMVKRIIRDRGGVLKLISDGQNGTEIKFTWPLLKKNTYNG